MPDITYKFISDDEVTPTINKIKSGMDSANSSVRQFNQSAEGSSEVMKQMKELMSGIGYNIGLWNVGFMASQKVMDLVTGSFQKMASETLTMNQMQYRLGLTNAQTARSWFDVREAAFASGVSYEDTAKRVNALMEQGFSFSEATRSAEVFQKRLKETGVDVQDVVAKARLSSASIEEIAKVSTAGGPYAALQPAAMAAKRAEAQRPYDELAMSRRQQMEDRAFEANVRRIDREMTYRDLAVNREMENRHRALGYEMEDRRRAMSRRFEDEQRQASLIASVGAAMPGAFDVLQGKFPKSWTGYLGAQILQPELKAGEAEIQKETGISPSTIEAAMRAGMSPGVVLQAAQAARERERAKEQRKFEDESVALQRAMVEELKDVGWGQVDEKMAKSIENQDQGIDLQIKHQNERNKFEDDASAARYDLNVATVEAAETDDKQRAIMEKAIEPGGPREPGIMARRGVVAPTPELLKLPTPPIFPFNLWQAPTPAALPARPNLGPESIGVLPFGSVSITTGAKGDKPIDLLDKVVINTLASAKLLADLVKTFTS